MKRFLIAFVMTIWVLLSPAHAHDLYKPNFESMDRDQDGFLTVEEMSAALDLYFTAHDLDGDGALTMDEFPSDKNHLRAGFKRVPKKKILPDPAMQAAALLDRLDVDENGGLSFEELNGAALKRFDAQDTDGDGELTAEELEAGAMARSQKRDAKPKTSFSPTQKAFMKWDANSDGLVSKAELPTEKILKNVAKVFLDLDVNEDAKVSIEEFAVIAG